MLLVEGRGGGGGGGGDVSGGLNNVVRSARGGARRQFGNSWFISSLVNALFASVVACGVALLVLTTVVQDERREIRGLHERYDVLTREWRGDWVSSKQA